MACSVCRKAGHTKRSCPIQKEEKIRIQRDRTNMFIQIFPALMDNPMLQGLLWWQISKLIPNANYLNTTIVGASVLDIFIENDITDNLPQGVVFGAVLQETEKSDEYVRWLKKKVEEGTTFSYGASLQEGLDTASTGFGFNIFEWFTEIFNIDLSKEATEF